MKRLVLSLFLVAVCSFRSAAQSEQYQPVVAAAPAYKALKDTTASPAFQARPGDKLLVVAQLSPQWFRIRRTGTEYVVPARAFAPGTKAAPPLEAIVLPVDAATGLVTYAGVVPAEGVTQAELFSRGKVWFVNNFSSAKAVLQVEEKDAGLLVGRAWRSVPQSGIFGFPIGQRLWYTVRLSFKEGRYKYELNNFALEAPATQSDPDPAPVAVEQYLMTTSAKLFAKTVYRNRLAVRETANELAASIKAALAKPASGDW